MLNPESADLNLKTDIVKLVFTDNDSDEAVKIMVKRLDAMKLAKMIQTNCNWKAVEKKKGII